MARRAATWPWRTRPPIVATLPTVSSATSNVALRRSGPTTAGRRTLVMGASPSCQSLHLKVLAGLGHIPQTSRRAPAGARRAAPAPQTAGKQRRDDHDHGADGQRGPCRAQEGLTEGVMAERGQLPDDGGWRIRRQRRPMRLTDAEVLGAVACAPKPAAKA